MGEARVLGQGRPVQARLDLGRRSKRRYRDRTARSGLRRRRRPDGPACKTPGRGKDPQPYATDETMGRFLGALERRLGPRPGWGDGETNEWGDGQERTGG